MFFSGRRGFPVVQNNNNINDDDNNGNYLNNFDEIVMSVFSSFILKIKHFERFPCGLFIHMYIHSFFLP